MAIDDRVLYPVYAKADELGLHVALHTGINYTVSFPIRNDQPLQLDQVACDFPGLVLIACHAGWPWVAEMVAVLRKHPNVYAEFGGLAPRYVCEPNTGWEVMKRFMNSLLSQAGTARHRLARVPDGQSAVPMARGRPARPRARRPHRRERGPAAWPRVAGR